MQHTPAEARFIAPSSALAPQKPSPDSWNRGIDQLHGLPTRAAGDDSAVRAPHHWCGGFDDHLQQTRNRWGRRGHRRRRRGRSCGSKAYDPLSKVERNACSRTSGRSLLDMRFGRYTSSGTRPLPQLCLLLTGASPAPPQIRRTAKGRLSISHAAARFLSIRQLASQPRHQNVTINDHQ